MSEPTPCTLHAWQPVLLSDGRTVILCGKCGQHAVTLPPETAAPFLPPLPATPQPYPVPYPVPAAPWTPWQPWPVSPGVLPTIMYGDSANTVVYPPTLS